MYPIKLDRNYFDVEAIKTASYIQDLKVIDGWRPDCLDKGQNFVITNKFFRQRTADDILKNGIIPICSDIGLVFRTMMIAQNIPTSYIEARSADFLFSSNPGCYLYKERVLARLFGKNGDSLGIFDPTQIRKYSNERELFAKDGDIIVGEGLDSWDLGIKSYNDLFKIRDKYLDLILNKASIDAHLFL